MSRRIGFGRRALGVRAQSTAIAALVAALALLLGSVVMLTMLRQANDREMYRAAAPRAELVARAVTDDGLAGIRPGDLAAGAQVEFIQVVDERGAVVAATPGTTHPAVVPPGHREPGEYEYLENVTVPGADAGYCAAVFGAEHDEHYFTVVAVVRAAGIRHGEFMTGAILLAELPIIVLVAAVATYLLVGRSLRPVLRITTQVREITATALGRRVPVPAAHDEVHTLATTMNDMLARLERSHDMQTRFLGDASHELRSPLTTLVGILDLADDTDSAVDLATVRTILQPEARRMQRMVDDLLLLARADENGLRLHPTAVDLDDLVLGEVRRLRALGAATVRSRIEAVRVTADPDMVGRALRNLTENAVRHTRSTVWLSITRSGGSAVLAVSDDGPGVPADQRTRIFERFSRLDVDRRDTVGAGLGLAIVAEIARAHGGSVEVRDGGHGGAEFRLILPCEPEVPAPSAAVETAAEATAAEASAADVTAARRGGARQASQSR